MTDRTQVDWNSCDLLSRRDLSHRVGLIAEAGHHHGHFTCTDNLIRTACLGRAPTRHPGVSVWTKRLIGSWVLCRG